MRRRKLSVAVVVGATAAALCGACASVLGDFTLSDTSGDGGSGSDATSPGVDGSTDTSTPGFDAGVDSSSFDGSTLDAPDTAPPRVTCALGLPAPIQVESLAGKANAFYDQAPQVITFTQDQFLVVETGDDGVYTAFNVDVSNKNDPLQGSYTEPEGKDEPQVFGGASVSNGIALLEQSTFPGAQYNYQVSIFSQPYGGGAPQTSVDFSPNLSVLQNNAASFLEIAPSDYEWAVEGINNADAGQIFASRQLEDGGSIFHGLVSTAAVAGGNIFFEHSGGKTRIFESSSPTKGSATEFTFADTATGLDASVPARSLQGGSVPTLITAAPWEVDGGAAVALVEITLAPTLSGTFRVGVVPSAQLDTFTSATLPTGATISTASDLPINSGGALWSPAGYMMVGLGSPSAGGFNLIWHDQNGFVRALQTGSGAVIASHTTLDAVGIAFNQAVGASFVTWNLAWSERQTDDGGQYDVLYVDTLVCQ